MTLNLLLKALITFSLFSPVCLIKAQDADSLPKEFTASTDSSVHHLINNNKDVADLFRVVFKKNTDKRKETDAAHLALLPGAGYSLITGFAVILGSSIAISPAKESDENKKLSSIISSITYTHYSQVIFPVASNIWSKNGKFNIISDLRYMAYPSTTFGLGGRSNINDGYTINFDYLKIHQSVLRKITNNFYGGIGYYLDYFWKVRQVNPPAGYITDFQKYGLSPTVKSSAVTLRLLFDSRLNQINPRDGWYGNVVYRDNLKAFGSDNNWQSLLIEVRKYLPFPFSNSKNTLAFWSYNWITPGKGKPPYLMLPSTGWDDFFNTGRGYIQSRYRGRNMLYLESEYRFGITNNGLLGAVVFANLESFSKQLSGQLTLIAPGEGVGLRIKLNKFSGANLCIDYGFGVQGSKGVAVNLGEVF